MNKKKSARQKGRRRQKNLQKPARNRIRKTWAFNPADRIENPKKGRSSQYNRQQWQKELDPRVKPEDDI